MWWPLPESTRAVWIIHRTNESCRPPPGPALFSHDHLPGILDYNDLYLHLMFVEGTTCLPFNRLLGHISRTNACMQSGCIYAISVCTPRWLPVHISFGFSADLDMHVNNMPDPFSDVIILRILYSFDRANLNRIFLGEKFHNWQLWRRAVQLVVCGREERLSSCSR